MRPIRARSQRWSWRLLGVGTGVGMEDRYNGWHFAIFDGLGSRFLVFLALSILACFLSRFYFDDFFGLFFKFDKIETA